MMKKVEELKNTPNLRIDDTLGMFGQIAYRGYIDLGEFKGTVVWGYNEDGWEHVSVSHVRPNKMPGWNDMCKVKDMFWDKEDTVVQIHPAESEYFHGFKGRPNVLHLWRPADGDWSIMNRGKDIDSEN